MAEKSAPADLRLSIAAAELGLPPGGFVEMVDKVAPSVVNIDVTKVEGGKEQSGTRRRAVPQQDDDDAMPFPFRFFGPGMPLQRPERQMGTGSGVIVSPDGYILTNNHVVEDATKITVRFNNRKEVPAKLIGRDEYTDIAVIKIDGNYSPVTFGDSDKVKVGMLTLAMGNPFGLGQTTTMGIVSALGRSLPGGIINVPGKNGGGYRGYEDFIQTDASINRGNSGGALLNTRGELIGINTAILSATGVSAGVGFAVPVNLARDVMQQLVKNGKVNRAMIGINLQQLTNTQAQVEGLGDVGDGAVITGVQEDGPGGKAGLKVGDIITQVNGEKVTLVEPFRLKVSRMAPGSTVALKVWRDGKSIDVKVTLTEYREAGVTAKDDDDQPASNRKKRSGVLEGVDVDEVTPTVARRLNLPASSKGVVITSVDPNSAAAAAGLRPGMTVEAINRKPVATVDDFDNIANSLTGAAVLRVKVGNGQVAFIPIEPDK